MRTTPRLSDALVRTAKKRAADDGMTLTAVTTHPCLLAPPFRLEEPARPGVAECRRADDR